MDDRKNGSFKLSKKANLFLRIGVIVGMAILGGVLLYAYFASNITMLPQDDLFDIGACFFGLIILIAISIMMAFERKEGDETTVFFYLLMILLFLEGASDINSTLVEGKANWNLVNVVSNTLEFSFMPLIVFVFWNYQNSLYSEFNKVDKMMTRFLFGFVLLDIVFIGLNIPFGYLFTINDEGHLLYSNGYVLSLIVPVLLIAGCFVSNILRKMELRRRFVLIFFCLSPLAGGVLSFFFPHFSFIYLILVLETLLMYGIISLDKNLEIASTKEKVVEKESQLLVSQINPHFVYNTLSAISSLCSINPELAQETTNKFSDYLRANMAAMNKNSPIPFVEELKHVETYAWIEELRFGKRIKVNFDIGETDFLVPALSIQPMVENAIKHGLSKKESGGSVTVKTYSENGFAVISIIDDGTGFDIKSVGKDGKLHIGIKNVSNRIETMVGGTFAIESKIGEGTKIIISIPKEQK